MQNTKSKGRGLFRKVLVRDCMACIICLFLGTIPAHAAADGVRLGGIPWIWVFGATIIIVMVIAGAVLIVGYLQESKIRRERERKRGRRFERGEVRQQDMADRQETFDQKRTPQASRPSAVPFTQGIPPDKPIASKADQADKRARVSNSVDNSSSWTENLCEAVPISFIPYDSQKALHNKINNLENEIVTLTTAVNSMKSTQYSEHLRQIQKKMSALEKRLDEEFGRIAVLVSKAEVDMKGGMSAHFREIDERFTPLENRVRLDMRDSLQGVLKRLLESTDEVRKLVGPAYGVAQALLRGCMPEVASTLFSSECAGAHDWAITAGYKGILEAVQRALELEQLSEELRETGNRLSNSHVTGKELAELCAAMEDTVKHAWSALAGGNCGEDIGDTCEFRDEIRKRLLRAVQLAFRNSLFSPPEPERALLEEIMSLIGFRLIAIKPGDEYNENIHRMVDARPSMPGQRDGTILDLVSLAYEDLATGGITRAEVVVSRSAGT